MGRGMLALWPDNLKTVAYCIQELSNVMTPNVNIINNPIIACDFSTKGAIGIN